MEVNKTMAGFNFEIPDEIHAQFKANCALDSVDMKDMLIELIKAYNKRREK